mmetsp:Transcript_4628/g.17128  ORF Transcript_4628/g.17128 Transcript_4628/m.17128 type:complete len:99 (+) Transcript_4628:658-954(+)
MPEMHHTAVDLVADAARLAQIARLPRFSARAADRDDDVGDVSVRCVFAKSQSNDDDDGDAEDAVDASLVYVAFSDKVYAFDVVELGGASVCAALQTFL